MFGAITGAIGIIKKAGPIIGGVKKVVGAVSGSKNEVEDLFKSFKQKLDSDGDGTSDFTTKEAIEFIAEVIVVVAKRL
jgi:hypothetical protein